MTRTRPITALILVLTLLVPAFADKANTAYKVGKEAEANNNTDAAYEAYKRAYDLNGKDARYMAAYARLRFQAAAEHVHKGEVYLEAGNLKPALAEFERAAQIDSTNISAQQGARKSQELIAKANTAQSLEEEPESPLKELAEEADGPIELQPLAQAPITLRMTENTKLIYKTVGALEGINVVFDPEYTPRKISVDLNGVSLSEALEIVALASKTFWRPVTKNTIYVAAESTGKRREIEQSVMKTFYLSNVSATTDLSDAANIIRSILDITRVQQVPAQNALIVRATPDQLVLVEKLLSDIDKARAEVMVDIAILEVTRDRLRTLGTTPPTSTSIALQGGGSGGLTLNDLPNLNATNFLISIPGASFTALMSDSNTKVIQNPQMRLSNNEKATLKIGDRVPVATGSFTPGVGGGGVSALVNTQFQYIDVGVNIDITPRIHNRREVTLKLGMEVSSVTGQQNIGGVTQPIIGQRRIEHETRLREGEVNLLGGILEDTESDATSGYPGLAKIPLLRYLFGQNQKNRSQREIVFAITPHIVRSQEVTKQNLRAIDVGTPSAIELRRKSPSPPAPGSTAPAPDSSKHPNPESPQTQTSPAPTKSAPPAPAATSPFGATPPSAKPPQQTAATTPGTPVIPATANGGGPTLSFDPTTLAETVGSKFKVLVSVSGAENVFSIPLQVNYDPKLLEVVDVANAGFLDQNRSLGQPVTLVFRADKVKGTLQITATRPPNTGGASGSGAVFALTFLAKAPGESVVDLSGAVMLDPTMQATSAISGDLMVTVTENKPQSDEPKSNPPPPPQQ